MSLTYLSQIALYLLVLCLVAKPLGTYMANVFEGRRTFAHTVVRPLEVATYRICGIDESREHSWKQYAVAMLAFNLAGFLLLYTTLRLQGVLPLNPQGFSGVKPSLAFNTAASFITNTNWQSYGGESTASYFSQMLGLTFQNFVSPAVALAVLVALARGLARHSGSTIGNFWVDLTRSTLYVLLPAAIIVAVFLVSQGVVQTFDSYRTVTGIEGIDQVIALGPAASQVAIKQLGSNGGGFFNANSAHPFENPTAWTNWVEMICLLLIPAGCVYMFGRMVGSTKHAWALFAVMAVLFVAGAVVSGYAEQAGTEALAERGVMVDAGDGQPGGNMEGKELRFGIQGSALWVSTTTNASNGAVNSMHDSYTPIGGLVPLVNMLTSEVIFGGVGSGMYGMFIYVVLAVFIAGLMVGRTPEYLGKKIEPREMKAVMLALLIFPAVILVWLAVASVNSFGTDNLNNLGPHGFSEMLYNFSSGAANNGSAFAGMNANSTFYNLGIGFNMLFGRFVIIVAVLFIAGTMVEKRRVAPGSGTFPTDGATFGGLLLGTMGIVGLLTFFPVLALGPIVEQLLLNDGIRF